MKLSSILTNIDAIFDTYVATRHRISDPIQSIFTKYVINKIKFILSKQIANDTNKQLDAANVELLSLFLREVYEIIRDTDIVAPHNPRSLLTAILLEISKQLATVSELSSYEILIPSITTTEYAASSTSISDPELQLCDFVLNDAGTAIIEVFNCLSQASIHGELKHTYLIAGQTQFLSETEQQRVIGHSKESKAYWEAIQNRIDVTIRGESFGAVLQRLANDLRRGGIRGKNVGGRGGQDFNSDIDGDEGLINFFAWYNALSDKDHAIIEEYEDIHNCIKRLCNFVKVEHGNPLDETTYCVELNADAIVHELRLYPELFNTYPENILPGSLSGKEEAELQVAITETALITALRDPAYRVTAAYDPESYMRFVSGVVKIEDLLTLVTPRECNYIFSPQTIRDLLNSRNTPERFNYLRTLKPILAVIKFHDWNEIGLILCLIRDAKQQFLASRILAEQIANVTSTVEDLKEIGHFFGDRFKSLVYKAMYAADPDKFDTTPSLYFYIHAQDHITVMRQKAITYLVTGEYPEANPIPEQQRLTMKVAMAETASLNSDQLRALMSLYVFGLRSKHLRAYVSPSNGRFCHIHVKALERLMQNNAGNLSPDAAIHKISYLENEMVSRLSIPYGRKIALRPTI